MFKGFRNLRSTTRLFCIGSFLAIQNSYAESLITLDEILMSQNGVREFIRNSDLQKRYYNEARTYYGLSEYKFPYSRWQEFLKQYRILEKRIPNFNTRMEETNLGQEFSIYIPFRSEGRRLNRLTWAAYQKDWMRSIESEVERLEREFASIDRSAEMESFNAQIREHQIAVHGIRKKYGAEADRKFFKGLRSNPKFRYLALFSLLNELRKPKWRELLETDDADIVLLTMDELYARPFSDSNRRPEGLESVAREYIPSKESLLSERSIFFPNYYYGSSGDAVELGALAEGDYQFVPFPRRFHTLLKGVVNEECIGGGGARNCDLVPERWATSGLRDSQNYSVEKNGKSLGFVEIIPIVHVNERRILGSVDLGSRVFAKTVPFKDAHGLFVARSFFDVWLERYSGGQEIPNQWDGLVMGDSNIFHNSGSLPIVRSSASYRFSRSALPHTDFRHFDPEYAKAASGLIPFPRRHRSMNSKTLLFGATVNELERIVTLGPPQHSWWENAYEIESQLRNADVDQKALMITNLAQVSPKNNWIRRVLESHIAALNQQSRQRIAVALSSFASDGVLTMGPNLDVVLPEIENYFALFLPIRATWNVKRGFVDRSIESTLPLFFSYNPSIQEVIRLLKFCNSVETGLLIRETALTKIRTAEEFIALASPEIDSVPKEYAILLDQFILDHLDVFLGFSPSNDQISELLSKVQTLNGLTRLSKLKKIKDKLDQPSLSTQQQAMFDQFKNDWEVLAAKEKKENGTIEALEANLRASDSTAEMARHLKLARKHLPRKQRNLDPVVRRFLSKIENQFASRPEFSLSPQILELVRDKSLKVRLRTYFAKQATTRLEKLALSRFWLAKKCARVLMRFSQSYGLQK